MTFQERKFEFTRVTRSMTGIFIITFFFMLNAHLQLLTNADICLADMSHLQGEYRSGSGPHPSEDASVSSVALVTIPITIALLLIIVLLLINQKKQWIPVSCYKAPTKVPCLSLVSRLSLLLENKVNKNIA